jgi:AcrR family transcriptional regulator
MAKKPIRSYYSLVRSKQADETRARIAGAARKLILSRGFDAATIEAIARDAGVAVPTVYAVFGSKRRILTELVERAAFGPAFQKLIGEAEKLTDPEERLRLVARIARQIYDGERSESELLRRARVVLPEIAARDEERNCGRYDAHCVTVGFIYRARRLNPAISVQEACDVLWSFTARDLYRLLVVERKWTPRRYEEWLAETLVGALMTKLPRPSRRRVVAVASR